MIAIADMRTCSGPGCERLTTRRYCSKTCNERGWRASRTAEQRAQAQARLLEIETHRAEREPAPVACGRWPTQEAAAEALRARMERDGGWWGPPMVRSWATTHGLSEGAALELLRQLVLARSVTLVGERDLPQWRAR